MDFELHQNQQVADDVILKLDFETMALTPLLHLHYPS